MSVHSWVQLHDTICFVFFALFSSVASPPSSYSLALLFLFLILLLFFLLVLLHLKIECVNARVCVYVYACTFSVSTFLNRICKVYLFFFFTCCFYSVVVFLPFPMNVCICRQSAFVFFLLNFPKTMAYGSYHTSDSVHLGTSYIHLHVLTKFNSHQNQHKPYM